MVINRNATNGKEAYVVTGPTSGFGRLAAFELANRGVVILVGRGQQKLDGVRRKIIEAGGEAVYVTADFSDVHSVRQAADQITALGLPIAGVLNNAGVFADPLAVSPQGWNLTYATNFLCAFAFTEALAPHLPDGAAIVFTCSGTEDPDRKVSTRFGFRGGRYISAEDSAYGRWQPGGAIQPGYDAYATSKQSVIASIFALARENPRLRFIGVEPGFNPGTGISRHANIFLRFDRQILYAAARALHRTLEHAEALRHPAGECAHVTGQQDGHILRREKSADVGVASSARSGF